jgi:hypothetical protein
VIRGSHVRRSAAALLAGLLISASAVAMLLPSGRAAGDSAPGLPAPEPDLSLPAIPASASSGTGSNFVMLGADASGEAFAYTMELPNSTGGLALATVGGHSVPSDWTSPSTQKHFVLFAHGSDGWHISQEALSQTGTPLPDFAPTGYPVGSSIVPAGQVAPGGSAVIAGTVNNGNEQELLVRDPGGSFRAAPAPATSLLPSGAVLFVQSSPVVAAVDDPGHGGAMVAPVGTSGTALGSVLHYDGTSWTREPIDPPAGASISSVLAIDDTSATNAYLLARTSDATGGVQLFKRETGATGPHWAAVQLDGTEGALFAKSSGTGYSALAPLDPGAPGGVNNGAQPLTATGDGAWVDGSFNDGQGQAQPFTIHLTVGEQSGGPHAGVHSWCNARNAGMCDSSLPDGLPAKVYRSIAWSGGGPFGSRVITGLPSGAILSLQGTSFTRIAGLGVQAAATPDGSAAFLSPTEGWTGGAPPVHFTVNRGADPLQAWPTPFREPLTAIAGEPGHVRGAIDAHALAVGADGEVARFTPGQGWSAEPLLTPAGVRATPRLRGVAWPEEDFAYAVGDGGAMWRWTRATGFWERDPATPLNFNGDLTGIAFDPSNPSRGYAVGLDGVLLRYDKSWTQETLPSGLENANFTSVTFAGSEAIAAFELARPGTITGGTTGPGPDSGLLVNDGGGWRLDSQEQSLTTPSASGPSPYQPAVTAVAGLPDGGAVSAGDGVLLERDSAGAPWRLARDPLPGYSIVAAAAIRQGPVVRALLSVDPFNPSTRIWPAPPRVTPSACAQPGSCSGDQGLPTLAGPYDLPANGWLLQETASGWQDVQHNAYPANYSSPIGADNPRRDDPIQALLIAADGSQGWVVGGETGIAMNASTEGGSLSSGPNATYLHTAGIYRYPAASTPPSGASSSPPPLNPNMLTVELAGGAGCFAACSNRDPIVGLGPPMWLDHAIASAAALSGSAGGPRAFIYTGGIVPNALRSLGPTDPTVGSEIASLASNAGNAAGGLPFAPVVSSSDLLDDQIPSSLLHDFSAFSGVTGNFPQYYSFDVAQAGTGKLRVVVIDDTTDSQVEELVNKSSTQYDLLNTALTSARAAHIPSIVIGARTLTTQSVTGDVAPTGAAKLAGLLVQDGASAYFFDSAASNVRYTIPAGAAQTIPSYGTGSLGYDAWSNAANHFGESGYLLVSINPSQVDPRTNRAPVTVRLIPNISGLALDARDGTVLLRSQVALFDALARRPQGGSGQRAQGSRVGPDPYIAIPGTPCSFQCAARVDPEFTFTSSHPDIANFVRHDPASQNPRAVFLDSKGKTVPDSSSGLLCAYNQGQTTVTVTTGGLSFSELLTVRGGQIRQPCGTVPLLNPTPKTVSPTPTGPPPPSVNPSPSPTVTPTPPPVPPPPPPPTPTPIVTAPPPAPAPPPAIVPPPPAPQPTLPFVPSPAPAAPLTPVLLATPTAPPPPNPTGFSGVTVLVTQPVPATQEERKEEHAIEEAQQFSAFPPEEQQSLSPLVALALAFIVAGAGASLRRRRRARRHPALAIAAVLGSDAARRSRRRTVRRRR